jgi:hypothetical protein
MLRRVLNHVQRNLVAYLALFIALSGTSFAAASLVIPANSVGSKQIRNGSIQRIDVSRKAVASLRGQRGPRGPEGPAASFEGLLTVDGPSAGMCPPPGGDCQRASSTAACPSGSFVVGGGWSASANVVVSYSRATTPASWLVTATNYAQTGGTISAHAVCVTGPSPEPAATRDLRDLSD